MGAFLTDIDSIKERGFVNKNVENNIITTTLRRVQDTMLLPILGTTFFKRLLQGVEDSDLTTDETTLLNDYILDYLVACVDYRIVKPLSYEIRSKVVGQAKDEHIQPATQSQINELEDSLFKDMEVYREKLVGYLKDNCTLFTEYNEYICSFENIAPDNGEARTRIRFA
jgi:hypothetical protein